MRVVAIIPARMGSSRFPGKPLQNICGLPMIEHVRRRSELMKCLDDVYVATCDQEIARVVESYGGKVIMTADTHRGCTDRIEEAARSIDADVVVNIQGDEPLVVESCIESVVTPFYDNRSVETSCIVYPIVDLDELASENIVKVVMSQGNRLLYLSRSPIPGKVVNSDFKYFKQSGIIAFKKTFLHKYTQLPEGMLEVKESVDMLRVLEHDYWIQGVISTEETLGVDIPEQVPGIEKILRENTQQKELFNRIC